MVAVKWSERSVTCFELEFYSTEYKKGEGRMSFCPVRALIFIACHCCARSCRTFRLKFYIEDFAPNEFHLLKVRASLFSICASHLIHSFCAAALMVSQISLLLALHPPSSCSITFRLLFPFPFQPQHIFHSVYPILSSSAVFSCIFFLP